MAPLLSVIIPVYNEKDTILEILKKVQAIKIDKEIIIVDDCSNDGSEKTLAGLLSANDSRIKVVFHERNMGKGAAIRTGLANIGGDIVIIQDADLELDPADYADLIQPIVNNETEAVFGARKQEKLLGFGYKELWFTVFGHMALKLIYFTTNLLYNNGTKISDVMSGYKVVTARVMKLLNLKSERFDIETEICAKLIKRGYWIKEVPIKYYPRTYREGKKIGWRDVWPVIYSLLIYKFVD